jgi:hypothetical protein
MNFIKELKRRNVLELTPEGLKREDKIEPTQSVTAARDCR